MSDDGAGGSWSPPGRVPAGTGRDEPRMWAAAPRSGAADADVDASPFAMRPEDRDRLFAGPGYTSTRLHNDGAAVAAMVVGVVGIVVPGLCLVAIALGHVARRRLRTSYAGGSGLAVAGLVLGYAGLVLWVAILLLYLALGSVLA